MNNIITTMNLWVAATKNGALLSHGSPSERLSYHLVCWHMSLGDGVVSGTNKWEIMSHIRTWNKQCGNKKDWRCKAVKVAITVEAIKKGKSDEQ